MLGWFLIGVAAAEARQAVVRDSLRGIPISRIMTPDPVTVPAAISVQQFPDDYLFRLRHQAYPVTGEDGAVIGLVSFNRIKQVPAAQRDQTRLADVACPLAEVATASPSEPAADLLTRLTSCAEGRVLVFDAGRLAGIISPSDISRTLDRLGISHRSTAGRR
ncbi:MAG TPA: CBS domain-containing protein [Streptosporangiaceae bacterium]|nr:CBS domain-containing protein [Streptosporangiaceae bacterium]